MKVLISQRRTTPHGRKEKEKKEKKAPVHVESLVFVNRQKGTTARFKDGDSPPGGFRPTKEVSSCS